MEANKRVHRRFAFSDWAWGKVVHEFDFNNEFKMYKLLDLSQGGLSLLTNSPHDFKKGSRFVLSSIEGRNLQKEILVEVRYVMESAEGHRVGCEFLGTKEMGPFIRGFSSYGFQS